MTINNFIQFVEIINKYDLQQADGIVGYYNSYSKICNCKPTLKNLYYQNAEQLYVTYVNSHIEHIKQKIEPLNINDSIIEFKTNNKIFCVLNLHKNAL